MQPAEYNLPVTRGDDLTETFYVRSRDVSGNKIPLDMTGYLIEAKLYLRDGTTQTITASYVTQNVGLIKLFLSRTILSPLEIGSYKWGFAITNPAGEKLTYLDGVVNLRLPGGPR